MKRKTEVRMLGKNGRRTGLGQRSPHPLVLVSMTSTTAENEQGSASGPANGAEPEALISVWWDHLPGVDHEGNHGGERKQPSP